jgi:hypothetical protein
MISPSATIAKVKVVVMSQKQYLFLPFKDEWQTALFKDPVRTAQ